jgi:glycosyltransferase involved in cell wall biosynthesis
LWRYLNRTRPDVLMTFMFHANVAGRIVGRLAWVPCVVSSLRIVGWESRFRILIDRATCHLADRLTTNSAAGVRFWARELRVPEERITLIYNGVDTDRFAPRSTHRVGSKVIGNLARLHRKNDHVTLLRALGSLAADTGENSWTCRIAGDGPEKAVLLELARRLGLTDRVQFVGHVDDPAGFLQDIDIYVQCSLAEGLSNSTLEAMACGLPVVATDVGGTSELVEQGKTGWLIPPREPDALAAALQRMLRDHDWCRGLGEEGRRIAKERFSVRRTVEATEALLDGLCAR